MRRTIAAIMIATVTFVVGVAAQTQVASAVHFHHTIESKVLGESRSILIHVPPTYAQSRARYPVIYMLDAHQPQNAMMVGLTEQQAWADMMPETIVVGIQNTDRSRDFTPTDDGKGGRAGGADRFLDFIRSEVIPLVESNYRTQPYRLLAGHSLGGLFAVYALFSDPALFNAVIAASPVLQWDKDFVIKLAAERLKQNRDWKKTLFVSVADEPDYLPAFNRFRELLQSTKPASLTFGFEQFMNENHASGLLPAYLAGLRTVFVGWPPPSRGELADLERHYKRLSDRFGYRVEIPEELMNRVGYQLLNMDRTDEAIAVFKRNVASYPDSANVYDSLADAYEKNGQKKLAVENYEMAVKLAEAAGNNILADASRRKLARLKN